MTCIIAYDIGTTGSKTCLYSAEQGNLTLLSSVSAGYGLTLTESGGVEQQVDDWWDSMCRSTGKVLAESGVAPGDVTGVSFCSQMQCLVLVDERGKPVRPAMSYMDKRGAELFESWRKGPLQIAGVTIGKLLTSLSETGVVAASGKDPVFRYGYVREHEPEAFRRVKKWLDAKEALIVRATGRFVMSEDSAFATFLYNPKKRAWSLKTARLHGVNPDHLPEVIRSTDPVGPLTKEAAGELGLTENAVVYAGGGDSSLIGIGCGAARLGDTHVYIGTSGWVSTVVDKQMVDVSAMIASIVGAVSGRYNYFAEMETAGKSFEWAREQLCLDTVGIYPRKTDVVETGDAPSVLAYMDRIAGEVPAGSGGVLFTPWLLGNRCPFEDASCRSIFFNVGLGTTKAQLIRAVYEGVLYHAAWMYERQGKKAALSGTVRIAGGGAKSDLVCQMLADILGKPVQRTASPQNAGALGACVTAAVGMGLMADYDAASALLPVEVTFTPDPARHQVYQTYYAAFKLLYKKNKSLFAMLNQ